MAKTRYVEFTIHLMDRAVVAARQAEFPTGIRIAPATAATIYAAPIQTYLQQFAAPCTRSPWIWATNEANYPRDVATFQRKTGGWFGIHALFGTTVTFIWVGKFVYAAGTTPEIDGVPTEIVAIAQRRWACGFEIPVDGDTQSGFAASRNVSRAASRHLDGLGWAYRRDTGDITFFLTRWKPGNTRRDHWDRFYIRVLKAPSPAAAVIWKSSGGTGGDRGIQLALTSNLQIAISNVEASTPTLLTSTSQSLVVGTWARMDVVLSYATAGSGVGAYVEVWINGTLRANITGFPASGLGSQGVYLSTLYGSAADTTLEADFDDCIGSEIPTKDSLGRYVGLDWLSGSKVQRLMGTSFGAGHDAVNWTNQSYSNLNQYPETNLPSTGMVSTTAAAALELNTDAKVKIDGQANAIGIVYLQAIVYHNAITAGAHTLGFKIGADPLDLLVLPAFSGLGYQYHYYKPVGLTVPRTPVDPIILRYLKDNDATSDTVYHLGGVAEVIGTFGNEDVFPGLTAPTTLAKRALGAHNNLYAESPWARLQTAPPAPYIIHSGTYSGNSTGQDLIFRLPVHWIMIRRIDTATFAPSVFFAASLGSTDGLVDQVAPDRPAVAFIDPTFVGTGGENAQEQRTIVRITGAETETNVTGGTYQYVAVSDPLGRFLLTGGFFHGLVDSTNIDALANAAFTPETGFFQFVTPNGGAGTNRGYFKGLGHAANAISPSNLAEIADFLSWGLGQITLRDPSTVLANGSAAYAVWRRDDKSGETALAKAKCVQLGFYVGNGGAARTIAYGPTGVRPLFLWVQGANATAHMRDPGHLGTASKTITGLNVPALGITAGGIDTFDVALSLNANGIIYSWFLLPGSATAGNGGWSIDGEFIPVEPDTPFDGPFPIGDEVPPGPPGPVEGDTPPDDTDDCDAGEVCVAATTRMVNEALLEIGSTKVLSNYCTQDTIEAQVARILYEPSVRAVLHAFPWPFATKYAALVLVAMPQTNKDWGFAYRQPIDCIFERRISVDRGPGVDPKGPAFELSSDASGGLIFTNESAAVLEYTKRPSCVAFTGDPLFREALKWHLAAAMAPPVTRMTDKAKFCRDQFEICIGKANAIIRPDDPGLRVTPAWQTTDAACMTVNLDVVNLGLLKIGANTIANLTTDQSREAVAVNLCFEHELRATLRDYPWKFAKRYNSALVLVGGTEAVAVNPDWQYAYRLPADYVSVRRLPTTGTGRKFEREPKTFEVGTDATGALLFTNEIAANLNLEYTARIACACTRGDELFREALSWRLAAAIAPSLAQMDPEATEQRGRGPDHPPDPTQRISHKPNKAALRERATRWALTMYLRTLEQARVADANEAEPEADGDAEWIEGRN